MTAEFKVDAADPRRRLDYMAQGVLGRPMDRPEGPLKVSGTATYAHEWRIEGLCHGVLARAPATKGTVRRLGLDRVRAYPGVLAVVTDDRLLRNPAQGTASRAPVQSATRVDYFGQPIALVVAESFEQAMHAALALEIEIDAERDAAVDPEGVEPEVPERKQAAVGDLDAAMREARFSLDVVYRTPGHNSAAMEPHAAIAQWHGDDLLIHGSYQMLRFNVKEIADSLGIEAGNVRIVSPFVGGGFGAKLGVSPETVAAALAAREVGRPVAVALTRQQVFETTMRRSETRQRFRIAADDRGRIIGIGHEALVSNLPDESFSEPVTQATPFLYRGAHRVIGHRIARVHRTCAGSVRAPGEAVGITALENAIDELAEKAGIDPVEFRKLNIPEQDPTKGIAFSSRKLAEALDHGAAAFGWARRQAVPGAVRDGEWLLGMGVASAVRVNLLMTSQARVTLCKDGTARIETDMTDIGTGTYAILTQIAAEMLGLPTERVEAVLGDSDLPGSSGSGGSWGAASSGTSVFLACEEIRRALAERIGCEEGELKLKDGCAEGAGRSEMLTDLLRGADIVGEGKVLPGDASRKVRQASWGAYFAEVAVSAVTGEVRLRRMTGVFAAGRILNAKTARSQCIGGMIFGIGIALGEELQHDPRDGRIVNRDFAGYHIPVNADVPQLDVVLLDERDDWANPLQAKGIGELGICGAAAAVTNAIYNATGVRVRDYPATLDKLLPGLMAREGG